MAQRPLLRPDDQRTRPPTRRAIRPRMEVALSLRDRTAERAKDVNWLRWVNRANDVGEAFGVPVAERQGYFARPGPTAVRMAQRPLLRPNDQRPRPPTCPAIRPRMEIAFSTTRQRVVVREQPLAGASCWKDFLPARPVAPRTGTESPLSAPARGAIRRQSSRREKI